METLPRPAWGRLLRVFLFAFILYAYFMPQWADWNIDSRLDLSHAIVAQHSLSIDRYHYNTWDKAVYHGHYYSDKAPGTALLGAGVLGLYTLATKTPGVNAGINALERNGAWNTAINLGKADTQLAPAAKGRNLGGCQRTGTAGNVQYIPWGNRLVRPFREWALSKYVVSVGAVSLLSALFVAFLFWFIGLFVRRALWQYVGAGLYAFGTAALPYSTNFYSHQIVAGTLFVAFALLYLLHRRLVGTWAAPAAGFLLGFSLLTEYTVALVVGVLALYALWVLRSRPGAIAGAAIAGAIPLAALMAYNAVIFSGPLDTGYSHDFCWSSAQGAGYAGFTYPKLGPLFDLTLGSYRGLFFMSPFLLLAFPGLWVMARRGLGLEAALCAVISVGFIVAISAYWGWNGGRVDGPRYLVPIIPFLAFPFAFWLDEIGATVGGAILTAVLGVLSLFVTGALFLGGPTFPTSWLRNPLTQFSLPALAHNDITSNAGYFLGLHGWQSLLPLAALLALVAVARRRSSRTAVVAAHPVLVGS